MSRPAVSKQVQHAMQITLLALLYFVFAKLSLLTAIPPGYATSVWPPSGLALASVLLLGRRVAPGIWIGAVLANLTVQASFVAAVMMGTGNALEALAGAALIRRHLGLPVRFQRGEDVFEFVALAAIASTVAATIGALAIAAVHAAPPATLPAIWWTWWQGDTTGIILVTPLILTWKAVREEPWTPRRALEFAALLVGLALVAHVAFGSNVVGRGFSPLVLAITLPLVIWAAFRFDQQEVILTVSALTALAVGYTVSGRGPLSADSIDVVLWQLLVFISIVAISGLAISAVVGQRRRAMDALRTSYDQLEQRVAARAREVRNTEESFRLLVESIQDYAIFMLDVHGNVASWNRGAEKIKGYRADEIIGSHVSRFYPKEARERLWPQQELALAKAHGRFEDEGWRVRKDGTQFWANVIITSLYDPDGNLRGFAKVTRDMTQRKRIEALEGSERRVNEFLAMLAHELRNPLAPIRNALDLMRLTSPGDEAQDWSRNVIDRQVTQLTRLVDDLLDVGRITSGKIVLKKEQVDLNATVRRAAESCHSAAEARRQTVDVRLTSEPLFVDGDPTRLSQIVVNLFNNAIKYTPDEGRIDIDVVRDGDWAMLRIKDTGIGMPPELVPKVFDLFVQGERSLARTEGGLGIGLTVVRQLVALHGGTAVARSEGTNRGSEFTVLLPVSLQKSGANETAAALRASTHATKRRVLVVDDNRDSAEMLAALLRTLGHDARVAYDGPAALAATATYRPDAVLLDIGLPGMSGYEVARRLRAAARPHPLTLIAFTGYGQEEDRRRARDAGFEHHLVKPVDPAALQKIIEAIPAPVTAR